MKLSINKSNGKNYSHSHSLTNSTTSNFEFVQPLFSRLMMPNSSIKGNVDSFVRLAPLPFPTFGSFGWQTVSRFVPVEDICPNFSYMMSRKPYTPSRDTPTGISYTPICVPYTNAFSLFTVMLTNQGTSKFIEASSIQTIPINSVPTEFEDIKYADCQLMPFDEVYMRFKDTIINDGFGHEDVYDGDDNYGYTMIASDPFVVDLVKAVSESAKTMEEATSEYNEYYLKLAGVSPVSVQAVGDNAIVTRNLISAADYVIVNYNNEFTTSSVQTIRLTALGRQLRKVLLGLGYQFSNDDYTRVSLLPLFAWYKAYFDEYYPQRGTLDWASTNTAKVIQYSMSKADYGNWTSQNHFLSSSSAGLLASPTTSNGSLFYSFLVEIAQTFVCHDADYLSIHIPTLYDSSLRLPTDTYKGFLPFKKDYVRADSSSSGLGFSTAGAMTNPSMSVAPTIQADIIGVNGGVTDIQLRLLHRLTNMFNRDTLIGSRVRTYMRSHFDSDVLERLEAASHRAGYNEFNISIGDIDSTSDTVNGSDGAPIAATAGKGLGSGKMSFSYKSDTYGYLIVMGCITAPMQRYQGTDTQLFALTNFEFPQQQFDALGYEITPYSAVFDDNGTSARADKNLVPTGRNLVSPDNNVGFGFAPRYSMFKTCKNIVNGDLTRRATYDQYQSYFADRRFNTRSLEDRIDFGSSTSPYFRIVSNPVPFGGIYFQYQQQDEMVNYDRVFYNTDEPDTHWYFGFAEDNFIVHNNISFTEKNPLKPLTSSFDTDISGNDDNMNINV